MGDTSKTHILFVCHGNICRSPMAEFILRRLAVKASIDEHLEIASAATSDEEIGNPVYPLAKRVLATHGIGCRFKTAQRLTKDMFNAYDYIIGMDCKNINNINIISDGRQTSKVHLLLDFLPEDHPDHGRDIADPWYTRDFERAYNDILLGCNAIIDRLKEKFPPSEQ